MRRNFPHEDDSLARHGVKKRIDAGPVTVNSARTKPTLIHRILICGLMPGPSFVGIFLQRSDPKFGSAASVRWIENGSRPRVVRQVLQQNCPRFFVIKSVSAAA
jgi:hypothetical protein